MNFLIIGDIVGKVGVETVKNNISSLKEKYNIDFVIANGENSADGMGITKNIYNDLISVGVDCITMGNHTWGKKDIFSFIDDENRIIRPANYANGLPGRGSTIIDCHGKKIGVIDLIGRVNTGGSFDSPFEIADKEIETLRKSGASVIIVDFHAEATAEKIALGYYLKDKVNFVFGTHTHVQTADEKIYDSGMGYITDIGMTGPKNSIIGMEYEAALKRFLTQMPERYLCADGESMFNGIVFSFDEKSNKVYNIERISF